jgi:hypothetical protein
MRKEGLSMDITFNPCSFSLDSPFKSSFPCCRLQRGKMTGVVGNNMEECHSAE